jgi:hypothetical protein
LRFLTEQLFSLTKSENQTPTRRFPLPWIAEVTPNCFIVRDANGQQLAVCLL